MIESPHRTAGSTIEINGLGLQVIGQIPGQFEVGAQDERKFLLDVPAVYADCSGGMGASEYHVPGMYADGRFIDTFSCPGVVLPAGEMVELTGTQGWIGYAPGALAAFMHNGEPHVIGGRPIYRINQVAGAVPTVTQIRDLGPNRAGQSAVSFKGSLWIGTFNSSTNAWGALEQLDSSGVWTTHAGLIRRHLAGPLDWAPTGTPRKVMVATTSHHEAMYVYGDPATAGDWLPTAAPIEVADAGYTVLSITMTPRHVIFGTQGGIHDLDSYGRSPNLTPWFLKEYDINNGGMTFILDEYVYFCHAFGLGRVAVDGLRQDVPEWCNPGQGYAYSGEVYGRPQAGCTWNGMGIVGLYNHNTNETHVMMFKDRRYAGVDGRGPLVWHGAYSVVPGRATLLQVVSEAGFNPKLIIGVADPAQAGSTAPYRLFIQSLPLASNAYQELLGLGSHRFAAEGSIVFADGWPAHPTGYRDIWTGDIEGQQMKGTQTITVSANQNSEETSGELAWTEIGSSNSNGTAPLTVPTDFGPAARLRFKVVLTGSSEQPPVFMSLRVRADVNFKLSDIRTYIVDLRDDQSTAIGTPDPRAAYNRLLQLKRLCDQASSQVSMRDELGQTWQVRLIDIDWTEDPKDADTYGFAARLVVRFLSRTYHYDSGDVYGEGTEATYG